MRRQVRTPNVFVSGVTAFVFGWVISYFAAREMSFQLTILVYAIAFAVRTVVYAITEIVRCRKNNARIADVEPIAATRLTPIPITHEAPPADDPFDPFDETRQDAEKLFPNRKNIEIIFENLFTLSIM